ncbi:sulfatase-like hydrolase/transferase [Pseudophaeobacter flagellatus]|uniref:sulfatase-like hydrolase/transferase n=1 Tax=Pseudophaeobacter flagellatus TaxID=2899119 RepID=UPI001E57E18A|nr:sulfatase-like hydrolase/transferase [Pseudophaeobacter flagellatus]MCD9147436.1 sulfatase-like hydrolase/transferase [Pseudophaeobacter flagellatus]
MANGPKKNILLISMDDAVAFWRYKSIFGGALQTPNLDRICAQSTSFHSAYCQAPVCSPSRASFMSGLSPHHTGVTKADAQYFDKVAPQKMWPTRLREQGYYCVPGGKVMRGYGVLPKEVHDAVYSTPYSESLGKFTLGRRKRHFANRVIPDQVEYGGHRGGPATTTPESDNQLYDNQVANSVIAFLQSYDQDAPFYREVGLQSPHGPWTTPARFKVMYDFKSLNQPKDWARGFDLTQTPADLARENIENRRRRYWRQSVRNYFSALSYADYQIGRVWDALKASPHADNTLVVILSDHGMHLGERNWFGKSTLWEQVANVPLIIHDPRQPGHQVITDPVGLIDLGPTLMAYLDLPPIAQSAGRSLLPQIRGARVPDRAVPTFFDDHAAIRKGQYRFIRYGDGAEQLYDLTEDWWQTTNLGPEHPAYQEMRQAHAQCCLDYGLDLSAPPSPTPKAAATATTHDGKTTLA